jgi:hypothetical protein
VRPEGRGGAPPLSRERLLWPQTLFIHRRRECGEGGSEGGAAGLKGRGVRRAGYLLEMIFSTVSASGAGVRVASPGDAFYGAWAGKAGKDEERKASVFFFLR